MLALSYLGCKMERKKVVRWLELTMCLRSGSAAHVLTRCLFQSHTQLDQVVCNETLSPKSLTLLSMIIQTKKGFASSTKLCVWLTVMGNFT